MESFSDLDKLPPGFRFHPTDEELISHYLSHKVKDHTFRSKAIGEVNMNRVEPWDLTCETKTSEKECYYFCEKERKFPNGRRTNRATGAGYWKPTGKGRKIFGASKILVGMKTNLVFYKGRVPRGEKTKWFMDEYSLEGKHSLHDMNEWVICRIFIKGSGVETVHNTKSEDHGDLPPPKDCPIPPVGSFQVTPPGVGFSHNDEAGFSDDLSIQETGFVAHVDLDFVDDIYGSVDFDCLWN